MTDDQRPSMASLQESDYGVDRDYAHGSPHLSHAVLRDRIVGQVRDLVREQVQRTGRCRVLEVGAGHGTFTAVLLDAGATVTVTEMSEPSVRLLRQKFAGDERVRVIHDPEADQGPALVRVGVDLIAFISVLHHIPDYVAAVTSLVDELPEGGAFYSVQDPTWYPRRTRTQYLAGRGSYLAWRLFQGDVRRGLATRVRRLRGVYDETQMSDMVEYHSVRQGVDEDALVAALQPLFDDVRLWKYWSTQSALLQRLGDRTSLQTHFGLTARGRRPSQRERS